MCDKFIVEHSSELDVVDLCRKSPRVPRCFSLVWIFLHVSLCLPHAPVFLKSLYVVLFCFQRFLHQVFAQNLTCAVLLYTVT